MSLSRSELKPWARERLRGVQNCLFPSFTADLSQLDEEGIRWDVQQTIRHGFFATCCTTEAGLSFDEAVRFVGIVADEAGGRLLVSAVAMFDTIAQNIAFLQAVASTADMALVGYPPAWRPADTDEVFRTTQAMCAASDLPIVVYPSHKYSFGRFHPAGFPVELLERLVEIDSVVAVELALLEPGFIYETFRRVGDAVPVNCPWERWIPLLVGTYGQQLRDGFKAAFTEKGGTIASEQAIPFGTSDMTPFLENVGDADLIAVFLTAPAYYSPEIQSEANRVFVERYRAAYDVYPGIASQVAYLGATMYLTALKATGGDTSGEKVTQALLNIKDLVHPGGTVSMSPGRIAIHDQWIFQVDKVGDRYAWVPVTSIPAVQPR